MKPSFHTTTKADLKTSRPVISFVGLHVLQEMLQLPFYFLRHMNKFVCPVFVNGCSYCFVERRNQLMSFMGLLEKWPVTQTV